MMGDGDSLAKKILPSVAESHPVGLVDDRTRVQLSASKDEVLISKVNRKGKC